MDASSTLICYEMAIAGYLESTGFRMEYPFNAVNRISNSSIYHTH